MLSIALAVALAQCGCQKIATLGDSITKGEPFSTARPWPAQLRILAPSTYSTSNYAVSGHTSAQVRDSQWTTPVKGNGFHYVILLAGINDLRAGDTGLQVYDRLNAVATEALAGGAVAVVWATVLPWKGLASEWTAAKQTQTEDLNARIRAWGNGTTKRVVELYDVMGQPGDPALLRAEYDGGDGYHPSQAGSDFIAATVRTALGGL